jgi:hypothetical protein
MRPCRRDHPVLIPSGSDSANWRGDAGDRTYAAADELARRLTALFLPDGAGRRPLWGAREPFASDPRWGEDPWFFEYFDGETGAGLGASHQTGWTALVAALLSPRDA